MKTTKSIIRKLIKEAILNHKMSFLQENTQSSYNKDLTPIEECKLLLGFYTNMSKFISDFDAVIEVVIARGRSTGKKGEPNKDKLLKLKRDLKVYKEAIETEEDFTTSVDTLIQAINTNNPELTKKLGLKAGNLKNIVYEIIDFVHTFLELGTLTGYELSIDEYISLGEEAAKYGYTSSSYPGNESSRLEDDIDF